MSAITSFFVTPADGALRFTWDVCGTLISTANINAITMVLTDAAIPGAASSAIQTRSITPTIATNPVTGVESVVKQYIWSGLTNGTRYVSSISISTMAVDGTVQTYTKNNAVGLSTPGTVPIKPVFKAYPVSSGIRLKLTNSSGVPSYVPRTASDGFYGIRQIRYMLGDSDPSHGFFDISNSTVLTQSLTPDSSLEQMRDALVAYDQEFAITGLSGDTVFELAIVVSNALGDSLPSETLRITTGTAVAELVPVAVATLEYNRYNKVSANADVVNASTATVLFEQATNTESLLGELFPVQGYNIYRQDVSSNGTSLIPFSKQLVGTISGFSSIDPSGNAVGGQNQYSYGQYSYNTTLINDTANNSGNIKRYTFKYIDSNVTLGKYYSYTVRGFNAKGEGSEGTGSICRIASKAEAPIVVAEPSNNLITLNITNTAFNGYPMADVSSNFNYFVDVSGVNYSTIIKDASGNVRLRDSSFNTIVNGGLDKVTVAAITRNEIPSGASTKGWQTYIGATTVLNVRPYTNPSAPSGLSLNQIENGAPINGGCLAEWSVLSDASRNGNTGAITYNVYVGGVLVANNLLLPKHKITGLTNGVTYSITVAAVIFNTDLSAQVVGVQSSAVSFTPFQLPGPATAVDLSNATVSLTSLSALWSAPDNTALYGLGSSAIRYKYELTDMSSGEVVSTATDLQSQKGAITSLVAGTLYKLEVYSGVTFNSVVYYNISSVSAYRTLYTQPVAPVNLSLYPLDGRLRCTWDSAATNGVTMTGYDIFINNGTSSGVPVYVSSTPYNIEYFIAETDGSGNNLVNGTEYQVKVRSKGTVQNGTFTPTAVSGALTASVPGMPNVGPSSPVISASIAGQGSATVKWAPIPNASGYLVFQNDDLTASNLITVSPDIVTFTKSGLINGKSYTFRVVAYVTVGALQITSSDSPQAITTIVPYDAPDVVENLDYTIASETINLTWDAPTNAGGAGLNGNGTLKYKVVITDKSQTPVTIINQTGLTSRTFSQSGSFLNNKSYKVYVYAYYTGANGTVYTSSAATINTVIPNPAPQQISNLTAVAGDHSVKLSWTNPDDGYLYTRTKIAIWKQTNGGRYKLYRICDPTNTSFEDKVAAGSYRLPDNTSDSESNLAALNYYVPNANNASNNVLIALDQVVNGFKYKYKVTILFDRSVEGAQLPTPVESVEVTPNGKPIVDSIAYETFTGAYKVSVNANGGKLKDWLFMGISTTATETPVFQDTVPLNAVGSGNRDTTRQIAGNNTFEINIGSGKTFDNYLFVINNSAGIEIEVGASITDTA